MSAPRNILGISAYYHDAAAALVIDGKIVSAAQEERFTRKKMTLTSPFKRRNFAFATQIWRRRKWTRWYFTTNRF